ncbi:hypothetical protein GCM10017576_23430 [Microbacterium barkeri]|uniref:Replication-relaxation n=1 Tax=Microbacterium barkeri TaxID=33917 RepID=A0A9W6H519_9MICO|nr:hypothetical protein [Microbacterium barkeri]MDI6944200.1 hypothetical protein [Microbacterium barkeri]MDR6876772.1 hypothetical protein [Microbacterium barkeri]GLJ62213.1 hypothetical protein GCM10017576_23430 [Microbacterium barkeri]
MTTTSTHSTPSSVPNFMEDDEYESGVAIQPGTVEQPENSAQPSAQTAEAAQKPAESVSIGAVSDSSSADFNPILAGDLDEFDGETTAESEPKAPAAPTGKEWKQRVAAGEVKGYEHPNRGKSEDSPTKKKASTYRRKRLGEKDFTVLAVLLIHEFLTTKQVAIIRGITGSSARRLMLGLQEIGVVDQEKFPYGPQLWYLTGRGLTYLQGVMEIPEAAQPLHRKGHFDISKIRPNLLAAQVSAQLVAGTDTIRQHIALPLSTGIDLIPHLIPESYIRSEFTKAIQKSAGKGVFGNKEKRAKAIQKHWMELRKETTEDKEAQLREHPELWMLTGRSVVFGGESKHFHPADLILNLLPAGQLPIHLEIETSIKNEHEIRKIITTYMDPNTPNALGSVIYLTHEKTIAKRVLEIAQEVYEKLTDMKSKPKDQWRKQALIKVALLKDAEGNLFSGKVWDL